MAKLVQEAGHFVLKTVHIGVSLSHNLNLEILFLFIRKFEKKIRQNKTQNGGHRTQIFFFLNRLLFIISITTKPICDHTLFNNVHSYRKCNAECGKVNVV